MSSRFVNLFKKDDLDEQRAFQRRVAERLAEIYPENNITLPEDPQTIGFDSSTCGLQNIKAKFLAGSGIEDELTEILHEHFGVLQSVAVLTEREQLTWEIARPNVLPQIMPADFLTKLPLVHEEFLDRLVLGFVVDTEQAYSYISEADIERWGVEIDELRSVANENLITRSQGIEVTAIPGDNPFLMIKTMDGFDAARILSPALRSFFEQNVGRPFYFGVPNRDFLICWSARCDSQFHSQIKGQISNDFDEQAYPLSRRVFMVNDDDEISLAETGEADPRAADAHTN